ncbi:MAG: hypothetical protein JXA71_12345 [Chitinispirillaceae bacterium]|nr:hypothetical protein [Chitinispirillaceae bacterium]
MALGIIKEYDASLDTKYRITVRKTPRPYKNYHVRIYNDGRILMEPRVLIDPRSLSERTLRMMDKAMKKYSIGVRSDPVDTDAMRKAADALSD